MKKKLISILMCAMIGIMPIGCGSSDKDDAKRSDSKTEGKADAQDGKEAVDKNFSLQMSDSYTFTDPQDIEFDQRYVLEGDENSKLISNMANMGYMASKNDGSPAAEYQYFVTADEASATALAQFYTSQGQKITQEGNVLYAFVDGDTLEGSIISLAGTGAISDETVEAYVEMMKSFNGLVDYE